MVDSMKERFEFLKELRPFVSDESAISRIRVDLNDLLEAGEWIYKEIEKRKNSGFSGNHDIEKFLVDFDVNFIFHVEFHLKSLRSELTSSLENFPDDDT